MNHNNTAIAAAPAQTGIVTMGFGDLASFEFLQRTAKAFCSSTMVPAAYQSVVTKGYGNKATTEVNAASVPNCMIALDMAQRMGANPLMVMQNLHIIEGRPSWSSQFIIAAINNSGKFSPLRFDVEWLDEVDAVYSTYEWEDGRKQERKNKVRIRNARCVAWAIEKATGERLESAPVTLEMAVAEGWYGKNGSKWRSMPDLMLRYRSAAFFGRIYAPELLMGLPAEEEVQDVFVQNEAGGTSFAGAQTVPRSSGTVERVAPTPAAPAHYTDDEFLKVWPKFENALATGAKTVNQVIELAQSKGRLLTDAQKQRLASVWPKNVTDVAPKEEQPAPAPAPAPAAQEQGLFSMDIDAQTLEQKLRDETDLDQLYVLADLIETASQGNAEALDTLNQVFSEREQQLQQQA